MATWGEDDYGATAQLRNMNAGADHGVIAADIAALNRLLQRMKQSCDQLGSARDNSGLHQQLRADRQEVVMLHKRIAAALEQVSRPPLSSMARKLRTDYQRVQQASKEVMGELERKSRQVADHMSVSMSMQTGEQGGGP